MNLKHNLIISGIQTTFGWCQRSAFWLVGQTTWCQYHWEWNIFQTSKILGRKIPSRYGGLEYFTSWLPYTSQWIHPWKCGFYWENHRWVYTKQTNKQFNYVNKYNIRSLNQSSKGISGSVCEFISNFLTRIVKNMGHKLILGDNFINKNSDDFYVLQLWFFDIFGLDYQK